jgi:hypothetical protein
MAKFKLGTLKEAKELARFDKLSRMHEREGKAISSLMTKLRLTPQAKYSARAAYAAAQSARSKPWELGG